MNRLSRDTCSYVCPQTWLNKARSHIGLSSTMGFSNENDGQAYLAILRELPSGLCFTVGLFQDFKLSLLFTWLFQGAREGIVVNTPML